MEEQVIRLDELFEALKKRWLMIVSITLIATIISAALSFFVIKPQYEASTKVFIGKDENDTQGYNQNDVVMYQKLMKTYSETIKTRDLVSRALDKTSFNLESENVLKNLTVASVTDTQILQIKYISNNPEEAVDVIKEISNEFIKISKELVTNGNIKIIEEVKFPENPVSPNKKMNIAIAFLLGLIVSVGLAFLLEFLDNTFKTKEQLERELDIPVIGIIPTVKEL
ncbi:MAG: Wzz/FepE/Etk N-terminal domain-containing protein [Clostridium sp.]|uniref:YveK family protein n=1 Tax=Clostridium sp. TaxID=1506 RepID=UPI001EB68642|nr:Wzz/FepE/Etk N-terminal domain-containing protein [Clostridium sp.]MBS5884520.1 capsular biosynthesis protein [Clostridium sp.]MDU7147850.1 Wzz/FepE/Etk N-terminal domain-containing protein [Clostridium sp.]